jgi:hypothetical protein
VYPDGATVLQYSLMRQQKLKGKHSPSRYRYYFYVIYPPSARECAEPLADLNLTLVERESPVLIQDIQQGSELREWLPKSGTCPNQILSFVPSICPAAPNV